MLHSVDRSPSKLYELKIQPGGQVIGVGRGGWSETHDDYESQQLFEPVISVPCHSIVESARIFNTSKLYIWLNEVINKIPPMDVFSTRWQSHWSHSRHLLKHTRDIQLLFLRMTSFIILPIQIACRRISQNRPSSDMILPLIVGSPSVLFRIIAGGFAA
jgi:hypothetical protein